MFKRLLTPLYLLLCLCAWSLNAQANSAPQTYQFPLHNAFEATIAGTPSALQPKLPDDADIQQRDYSLRLRPEREFTLPSNFWPVKTFRYRLAKQAGPAPLICVIAGTGSNYSSSTMQYIKRLFYGAGYHVALISSPTAYDFMVGASTYATPGYSPQDAVDLYSVMRAIQKQQSNLEVTDWHLTGYSLGGLQIATDFPATFAAKRAARPQVASAVRKDFLFLLSVALSLSIWCNTAIDNWRWL